MLVELLSTLTLLAKQTKQNRMRHVHPRLYDELLTNLYAAKFVKKALEGG